MLVAGREPGPARRQRLAVASDRNPNSAGLGQLSSQQLDESGRHVLDDEDRLGEVVAQAFQQVLQGRWTAGGGRDHDQLGRFEGAGAAGRMRPRRRGRGPSRRRRRRRDARQSQAPRPAEDLTPKGVRATDVVGGRLGDVIGRARLDRLQSGFGAALYKTRRDQDLEFGSQPEQAGNGLDPAHHRHVEIEDADVRLDAPEHPDRRGAIGRDASKLESGLR